MLKRRDFALVLPKLYVMTINELTSVFYGGALIRATELDCPENVAILANDICSILCHLRHRRRKFHHPSYMHKSAKASVRFRTHNQMSGVFCSIPAGCATAPRGKAVNALKRRPVLRQPERK